MGTMTDFSYERGPRIRKRPRIDEMQLIVDRLSESNRAGQVERLIRLLKLVLRELPKKEADKVITQYKKDRKIKDMGGLL